MPFLSFHVYVMLLLAWFGFAPPRRRLGYLTTLKWLIVPLLYLPYSLIRGAIIHWYPYPFLDPTHPGGYGRVAGACTLITAAFVGVALLLIRVGNALNRRHRERAAPRRAAEPGVHT